jgi:hypothetical protein
MSDWWSYRLSDFALFSERVYYRLFELHNHAVWPAQIAALALGLLLVGLLARRPAAARQIVPAILGMLWLWMAWSFFWRSYATINWAAVYVAPAAALEGLLLLWLAARGALIFRPPDSAPRLAALLLLSGSVLLYPVAAVATSRAWRSAELFGIAPDPTAVATLAALAMASGPARWAATMLPALLCALSGATLLAIDADAPWLPPLGAALALVLGAASGRRS